MSDGTLLLCYDGSDFAKRAIARAPALLADRDAIVLVAWQPTSATRWAWVGAPGIDFAAFDEAAEASSRELAEEGVRLANVAGLTARAETVEAVGPLWDAIVQVARARDVSAIVVGSRGLTGLKSVVLGSVSEGIVRHAHRTTVVVQEPPADAGDAAEAA